MNILGDANPLPSSYDEETGEYFQETPQRPLYSQDEADAFLSSMNRIDKEQKLMKSASAKRAKVGNTVSQNQPGNKSQNILGKATGGFYDADSPYNTVDDTTGTLRMGRPGTDSQNFVNAPESPKTIQLKYNRQATPQEVQAYNQSMMALDNFQAGTTPASAQSWNDLRNDPLTPEDQAAYDSAMAPIRNDLAQNDPLTLYGDEGQRAKGYNGKLGRQIVDPRNDTYNPLESLDSRLVTTGNADIVGDGGLGTRNNQILGPVDRDGRAGETVDVLQSEATSMYGKVGRLANSLVRSGSEKLGLPKSVTDMISSEDGGTDMFSGKKFTELSDQEIADKMTGVKPQTRADSNAKMKQGMNQWKQGDYVGSIGTMATQLDRIIAQSVPSMGVMMVPYVGLGTYAGTRTQEQMDEYSKNNNGDEMPAEKIATSFATNLALAMPEKLMAKTGISNFVNKIKTGKGSIAGNIGAATFGETLQEGGEATADKYFGQKEGEQTVGEIATSPETQFQAAVGGLTGGAVSGGASAVGSVAGIPGKAMQKRRDVYNEKVKKATTAYTPTFGTDMKKTTNSEDAKKQYETASKKMALRTESVMNDKTMSEDAKNAELAEIKKESKAYEKAYNKQVKKLDRKSGKGSKKSKQKEQVAADETTQTEAQASVNIDTEDNSQKIADLDAQIDEVEALRTDDMTAEEETRLDNKIDKLNESRDKLDNQKASPEVDAARKIVNDFDRSLNDKEGIDTQAKNIRDLNNTIKSEIKDIDQEISETEDQTEIDSLVAEKNALQSESKALAKKEAGVKALVNYTGETASKVDAINKNIKRIEKIPANKRTSEQKKSLTKSKKDYAVAIAKNKAIKKAAPELQRISDEDVLNNPEEYFDVEIIKDKQALLALKDPGKMTDETRKTISAAKRKRLSNIKKGITKNSKKTFSESPVETINADREQTVEDVKGKSPAEAEATMKNHAEVMADKLFQEHPAIASILTQEGFPLSTVEDLLYEYYKNPKVQNDNIDTLLNKVHDIMGEIYAGTISEGKGTYINESLARVEATIQVNGLLETMETSGQQHEQLVSKKNEKTGETELVERSDSDPLKFSDEYQYENNTDRNTKKEVEIIDDAFVRDALSENENASKDGDTVIKFMEAMYKNVNDFLNFNANNMISEKDGSYRVMNQFNMLMPLTVYDAESGKYYLPKAFTNAIALITQTDVIDSYNGMLTSKWDDYKKATSKKDKDQIMADINDLKNNGFTKEAVALELGRHIMESFPVKVQKQYMDKIGAVSAENLETMYQQIGTIALDTSSTVAGDKFIKRNVRKNPKSKTKGATITTYQPIVNTAKGKNKGKVKTSAAEGIIPHTQIINKLGKTSGARVEIRHGKQARQRPGIIKKIKGIAENMMPAPMQKYLNKVSKLEHRIDGKMFDLFSKMDKETQLAFAGWVDPETLPTADREKRTLQNEDIERSLESFQDFIASNNLEDSATRESALWSFTYVMDSNNRVRINEQDANPQTDKQFTRHLTSFMNEAEITPENILLYKAAIVQAFEESGIDPLSEDGKEISVAKVEKVKNQTFEDNFDDIVSYVNRTSVDDHIKRIAKAANGEGFLSLKAFTNLKDNLNGSNKDVDSQLVGKKSNMAVEADGKTNGTAFLMLQAYDGSMPIEEFAQYLNRAGVFTSFSGMEDYADFINAKGSDFYESGITASKDWVDKQQKEGKTKNPFTDYFVSNEATQWSRNFLKDPIMVLGYAMGIEAIKSETAKTATDEFLTDLMSGKSNNAISLLEDMMMEDGEVSRDFILTEGLTEVQQKKINEFMADYTTLSNSQKAKAKQSLLDMKVPAIIKQVVANGISGRDTTISADGDMKFDTRPKAALDETAPIQVLMDAMADQYSFILDYHVAMKQASAVLSNTWEMKKQTKEYDGLLDAVSNIQLTDDQYKTLSEGTDASDALVQKLLSENKKNVSALMDYQFKNNPQFASVDKATVMSSKKRILSKAEYDLKKTLTYNTTGKKPRGSTVYGENKEVGLITENSDGTFRVRLTTFGVTGIHTLDSNAINKAMSEGIDAQGSGDFQAYQIFDAVVADINSVVGVAREANKNFYNINKDYSTLDSITKSANKAQADMNQMIKDNDFIDGAKALFTFDLDGKAEYTTLADADGNVNLKTLTDSTTDFMNKTNAHNDKVQTSREELFKEVKQVDQYILTEETSVNVNDMAPNKKININKVVNDFANVDKKSKSADKQFVKQMLNVMKNKLGNTSLTSILQNMSTMDTDSSYDPKTGEIKLSQSDVKKYGPMRVLAHELGHALTVNALESDPELNARTNALFKAYQKAVPNSGINNEYEFAAEFASNPKIGKTLSGLDYRSFQEQNADLFPADAEVTQSAFTKWIRNTIKSLRDMYSNMFNDSKQVENLLEAYAYALEQSAVSNPESESFSPTNQQVDMALNFGKGMSFGEMIKTAGDTATKKFMPKKGKAKPDIITRSEGALTAKAGALFNNYVKPFALAAQHLAGNKVFGKQWDEVEEFFRNGYRTNSVMGPLIYGWQNEKELSGADVDSMLNRMMSIQLNAETQRKSAWLGLNEALGRSSDEKHDDADMISLLVETDMSQLDEAEIKAILDGGNIDSMISAYQTKVPKSSSMNRYMDLLVDYMYDGTPNEKLLFMNAHSMGKNFYKDQYDQRLSDGTIANLDKLISLKAIKNALNKDKGLLGKLKNDYTVDQLTDATNHFSLLRELNQADIDRRNKDGLHQSYIKGWYKRTFDNPMITRIVKNGEPDAFRSDKNWDVIHTFKDGKIYGSRDYSAGKETGLVTYSQGSNRGTTIHDKNSKNPINPIKMGFSKKDFMPLMNEKGEIVNYRYSMPKRVFMDKFEMDHDIGQVFGNSLSHSMASVEEATLNDDMADSSLVFVVGSLDDIDKLADLDMKELPVFLSTGTENANIQARKDGKDAKDMIQQDDIEKMISSAMTVDPKMNDAEKAKAKHLKKIFSMYGTIDENMTGGMRDVSYVRKDSKDKMLGYDRFQIFKGDDNIGAQKFEALIRDLTQNYKWLTVMSPFISVPNLIASTFMAYGSGVPLSYIMKYTSEWGDEYGKVKKDMSKLASMKIANKINSGKYDSQIAKLEEKMSKSSIYEAFGYGINQSIMSEVLIEDMGHKSELSRQFSKWMLGAKDTPAYRKTAESAEQLFKVSNAISGTKVKSKSTKEFIRKSAGEVYGGQSSKLGQSAASFLQIGDAGPRYSAYMYHKDIALGKGMSEKEAQEYAGSKAQEYSVDYRATAPKIVKTLGSTPIAPFAYFSYAVLPIMYKLAFEHPLRFMSIKFGMIPAIDDAGVLGDVGSWDLFQTGIFGGIGGASSLANGEMLYGNYHSMVIPLNWQILMESTTDIDNLVKFIGINPAGTGGAIPEL